MRRIDHFQRGMGIGGWLTNFKRYVNLPAKWHEDLTIGDFEHFDTYIRQRDIDYIASLGMDHIRLGFDQRVLEEAPGKYRDCIWRHLDDFVAWCRAAGVRPVLNLHKAVGNYCDCPASGERLLESEALQRRFIDLWLAVERHFAGDDDIMFELLNEVLDVPPEPWNRLAERTRAALRAANPARWLIIGGTSYNAPDKLNLLPDFRDERVIYTWHFYTPVEFTHQRALLQPPMTYYNRDMPYPADMAIYQDFWKVTTGQEKESYKPYARMDREMLRRLMQGAFDFADRHPDAIVWCGEFGVIRCCPLAYRENFFRDVISLLQEHDQPYCVWNYLSTPYDCNRFGLVDDDRREILSPELARIIAGN